MKQLQALLHIQLYYSRRLLLRMTTQSNSLPSLHSRHQPPFASRWRLAHVCPNSESPSDTKIPQTDEYQISKHGQSGKVENKSKWSQQKKNNLQPEVQRRNASTYFPPEFRPGKRDDRSDKSDTFFDQPRHVRGIPWPMDNKRHLSSAELHKHGV